MPARPVVTPEAGASFQPYADTLADADRGLSRGELETRSGDLRRLLGQPTNPLTEAIAAAVLSRLSPATRKAEATWPRGEYPNPKLDIKRVIAEGDMVVTRSHLDLEPGNPDNPGRALADFFRLENGKVVQHWDVIQDVPKIAANDNGMF